MRRALVILVSVAVLGTAVPLWTVARAMEPQAQPRASGQRRGGDSGQQAEPRPRSEPQSEGQGGPERARPRPPAPQPPEARPPRREPDRRRAGPPSRVLPPRYYGPRTYYFPPISLQRGFYYHPYFGFYYGPYYGPFYPYPGPYYGPSRYSASALRTRVMPVETEVWVNGYYAGVVDDFDGIFQRLYLPAGQQEIELYLDGYEPYRQQLFLSPGGTTEISHQMQPLRAGERLPPPDAPMALPEDWMGGAPSAVGDRPASPFGILALRIDPADAQILIDGEVWLGEATLTELVIHVPSGWHRLEVRRDGYQTFRTEIELSEGATTRLNVRLER